MESPEAMAVVGRPCKGRFHDPVIVRAILVDHEVTYPGEVREHLVLFLEADCPGYVSIPGLEEERERLGGIVGDPSDVAESNGW